MAYISQMQKSVSNIVLLYERTKFMAMNCISTVIYTLYE